MCNYLITLLGGFPTIEDAVQALKKTDNVPLKNAILTEAVKHLFNAISADDILRVDPETRMWTFEGKTMTEAQVLSLREEARILLGMKLWRVLKMDIRYQINKKMFEESSITMDLLWGKLLLYYDDVIRNRLQKLK